MVTYFNYTYCGHQFEMYRNIESLCYVTGTNSVVGQFYFKNKLTHRKTDQICGCQMEVGGGGIG